jgi:hypothetical protein
MKSLYVMLLLACWTTISLAADFNGIQIVPSWNQSGNLVVEVSNWSKLSVSVSQLTANLPGNDRQSCQLSSNQSIEIGPTQKKTMILAKRTAALACLRTHTQLRKTDMQTMQFMPVTTDDKASLVNSSTVVLTIEAHIEHRGQSSRSSSLWSMKSQEQ